MVSSLGVAVAQDAAPAGQQATIQGLVIGRDGPTMAVKTAGIERVTVVLTDSTKTQEKGGFLGLDKKDLSMAQLVPGLQVKVEGSYDSNHQLQARKITFSRKSFDTAQQIDAGLNPVALQVSAAQNQLKSDRKDIEQGQQDISKNSQDIDTTKEGLATTNQATTANTQAIGQTNGRFGSLDQYETKGSITVNFANGKATVSPKDKEQLTEFVKSAADSPGAMIEVQGYASAVGSATLNQKLSSERADAVLAIIQQTGAVPLTRVLAPAAMGTTDQLADNHTRSGQAQNRRVVVAILVNKGITG
jgi:OmpA-OmpF porin, OOP family